MMPRVFLVVLAALSPIAGLQAQGDSLVAGQRVMVQVSRAWARSADQAWLGRVQTGSAIGIGDTLRLAARGDTVAIPNDAVERLWMSVRPPRRGKYAAVGAGAGAVLGALFGLGIGDDCTDAEFICYSRDELAWQMGFGGALAGGLLGAALGGEHWRELRARPVRLTIVPAPRGALVRVALRT